MKINILLKLWSSLLNTSCRHTLFWNIQIKNLLTPTWKACRSSDESRVLTIYYNCEQRLLLMADRKDIYRLIGLKEIPKERWYTSEKTKGSFHRFGYTGISFCPQPHSSTINGRTTKRRYICVSHGSVSKANITPYIGLSSVLMSVRRSINYLTMIHIHILCNHLYTGELPPQLRFSERVPTCWDWETDSLLQPDDMDKKCNDFESLYVLHVRFYWCCINSI